MAPQNKASRCLCPAMCEVVYWLCLKLRGSLQLLLLPPLGSLAHKLDSKALVLCQVSPGSGLRLKRLHYPPGKV